MSASRRARQGAALAALAMVAAAGATQRATPGAGYRSSLFWRIWDGASHYLDRKFGWDKLPRPVGLAILVGVRNVLRRENLYDTSLEPAVDMPPVPAPDARHRTARTPDGTHNDLDDPAMGMAGSRFGRNVPIDRTWPDPEPALLQPSPRVVSRELLTRDPFQPATTVNNLAAAWLQFMIRDWFSHGKSPTENPWEVELAHDDPWPERPMRIMRTRPDPTRAPDAQTPPTYVNTESHWWDASQIYGTSQEFRDHVRSHTDGKLRVEDGLPPVPARGDKSPAEEPGFWLGLALLHALFTL